jgi:hypothetical protein
MGPLPGKMDHPSRPRCLEFGHRLAATSGVTDLLTGMHCKRSIHSLVKSRQNDLYDSSVRCVQMRTGISGSHPSPKETLTLAYPCSLKKYAHPYAFERPAAELLLPSGAWTTIRQTLEELKV